MIGEAAYAPDAFKIIYEKKKKRNLPICNFMNCHIFHSTDAFQFISIFRFDCSIIIIFFFCAFVAAAFSRWFHKLN